MAAFSLIEVTLAMGIIVFAGTTLLGLLSTGLNTMQEAAFDTIAARVASEVRADLQQTGLSGVGNSVSYYSVDGQKVAPGDSAWVYSAYLSESAWQMPGASPGALRRVAVQIVHNPAQTALATSADGWADVPATMSSKTLRFYVVR